MAILLVVYLLSARTASAQLHAVIDSPSNGAVVQQPFAISGWAVDMGSQVNSGVDSIAIYGAGPIGAQVFLGYATREARPDVAQYFGRPSFAGDAGYRFTVSALPPGAYQFGVMVHSAVSNVWVGPFITSMTIPASPIVVFDPPTTGLQPFVVSGLAGDPSAVSNSGISDVHVHAEPINGGPQILLGAARTGIYRPDAAATYGQRFAYAGWDFTVRGLPPGQYRLHVYARSALTGIWGDAFSVSGPIVNNVRMFVESPAANALVAQPFSLSGATADLAAVSGSGASVLHIYARHIGANGQPTGDFIWLGATVPDIPRPDLAGYVGGNPQFANIGFRLDNIGNLPPDTYEIAIFVLSTVSNQFHGFLTRVRVGLTAAPPVLTPPPGEYSTPIAISITSSTPGAVVRFTLDGSEPTDASPVIGSSFTLAMPGSARLRAFAPNMFPSATVGANYTFRAAAPVLSPPPGTYEGPQTVTVSTATPSASIRFTMDGSEPTEASPAVTGPAQIGASVHARVKAFRAGWLPSATVGGIYTIRPAMPHFSVPSGTYTSIQTVTMRTATLGGTIRYTTDGTDPTSSSVAYSGPLVAPTPRTIKARTFDAAGEASSVAVVTLAYQVATPTLSPASGVQTASPLLVTVHSATSHAVLRYTLNGTEPDSSSAVVPTAGVLSIEQSATLKVQASVPGWPSSPTVTGQYEFVVADPVVTPGSGTYARPFSVAASVATVGAVVRYTTDGTLPTAVSPVWPGMTNPVNGVHLVSFRAFRTGWTPSQMIARQFHITDSVAPTPTVSPAPGVHDVGVVVSVSTSDSQATVRVTIDGTEPNETSPLYAGPITLTVPTVLRARAFKAGSAASNVGGGDYVLRLPLPTVSPGGGTYQTAPRPTVTHATSGVTLRYTLNRHEPTESSPSVPTSCCIAIADDTTLKVTAFKPGWAPSRTVTNTYWIGPQIPPVSSTVLTRTNQTDDTSRVSEALRIVVTGTPIVPASVRIVRNGMDITGNAQISSTNITVSNAIVEGENDIQLIAVDMMGIGVGASYSIFGTSTEISIVVKSQANVALVGASVWLFDHGREWPLQYLSTDVAGVARALVPAGFSGRVLAFAAGYHTLESSITTSTTLLLEPRNENFERGREDWSLSFTEDAEFILHSEGPLVWVPGRPDRGSWALDGPVIDVDLLAGTWGSPSGLVLSRTIQVEPGVETVHLRYKFAANHPDSVYRLALSVPGTALRVEHSSSARILEGQGQAEPKIRDISSYWLTMSINVPPGSGEVRLEGVLPPDFNPGHTTTWFVIDQVASLGISMEPPRLEEWTRDRQGVVRKNGLEFLSLGPKGADSGLTQVNGTLAFNANPDGAKRVTAVRLDVSREESGQPVFSVPLRADVAPTVINQPFGATGRLSTGETRELFTLTASQMAQFSQTAEENIFLSVKAVDESGRDVRVLGGVLPRARKLTDIMADVSRYGNRDRDLCIGTAWKCYGDAWARPAFHRIMREAQRALAAAIPEQREAISVTYDDFSNSNGGYFAGHNFHNQGRHADCWVDGYGARDAALAAKMGHIARAIHAAMLADRLPNGRTTFTNFQILVAFNPDNPNDPFTSALMAQPPLGNRPLLSYFVDGGSIHRGHFHVQMF